RLSGIVGRSLCAWGFHWAKIYGVCRICRSPVLHSNPWLLEVSFKNNELSNRERILIFVTALFFDAITIV
ncbi:MAG: hypothetical protein KZQ66_12705, partial [Candidatus Thiodiazotropha sp. (ex Lucinoma aequizonata)]|nr:hypothetical protein [Candidatus Thiodiazotropha sp. (ex Lucinoma aequizonata)]MCU7909189.1 hypothetical protein [Candidatus Thiodiazotropha sp. (ex Lucinoma aequizonata)]